MLKDLCLEDNYSSDDSNIVRDLFSPCLDNSEVYYRSVGYLDSKMLAHLGMEFDGFSNRGGQARLLIGRTVSPDDYVAIKQGRDDADRFISVPSIEELWNSADSSTEKKRGLLVLSWLVANNVLSVKFSIRPRGIHHDKFAYFRDADGNEVIAHGSNNETAAANLPEYNYESLSVFKSWDPEIYRRHGEYKLREFLRLWAGRTGGAICVEAPDPVLEELAFLSKKEVSNPEYREIFERLEQRKQTIDALPKIPLFWGDRRFELFEHQKKAIEELFDNDYRGILALATGSGKTITAAYASTLLARDIAIANEADVVLLVCVPYQVLAEQWIENLQQFSFATIPAFESIDRWQRPLELAVELAAFNPKSRVTAVVAVNRTLQSDAFQSLICQVPPEQLILIGDECHRLGTIIGRRKLPDAGYRIGLSATPWAPQEEKLRENLESYFDKAVAHYSLKHAFEDEVLVPYFYAVLEVALTEEEGETYESHTHEVKKLQGHEIEWEPNQ